MFALMHKNTKTLMGFYTSSSEGDLCSETITRLKLNSDNIWVVKDGQTAEFTAKTDTEQYNADFQTPCNRYVGELAVVELKIK